jgi:citrate synthase
MFTCIFALARTVGWMTQWEEMITDPEYKIGRPRQLYIGAAKRDVVPLANAAKFMLWSFRHRLLSA